MTRTEFLLIQKALRLTVEEIADTLGVSAYTINAWRCGKHSIAPRNEARIRELMAMPEAEREKRIFRRKVRYHRAA
jgi:transcriptional regulator with XRE-family HTH domain